MAAKQPAARVRYSPAAMLTRGALLTYLRPRLAMDSRPHAMRIIDKAVTGLTSKNFRKQTPVIVNSLRRATQGRLLASDNGINDLAALLSALAPQAEQADQAPGLGQIATNPGGSAGPMTATAPTPMAAEGESHDIVAKIKAYLEEEGVAPEILNNLDAFLAEHQPVAPPPNGQGGDQGGLAGGGGGPTGAGGPPPPPLAATDNIENLGEHAIPASDDAQDLVEGGDNGGAWRDLDPRGGTENELKPESAEDQAMPDPFRDETDETETEDEAEDEEVPSEQDEQLDGVSKVSSEGTSSRLVNGGGQDRVITKSAMDKAIRMAQDAAIKTQRAIRQAERYVRPWVGDMAMDEARNSADVYRAALKALGVRGIDKVHPDALRPILEAQPRPGARAARDQQQRLAQDSATGKAQGSFLERFPDAAKITIQ